MNLARLTPWLAAMLAACAQVREPQGGPMDTTPPALVRTFPTQGALHFQATEVTLVFDEPVKLDRVRERMLVSPPMVPPPEVRMGDRNTVRVLFRAPLAPGTTYSIDLGDAVTDIREGNPVRQATYIFSTGEVLDSLTLNGQVHNARTTDPEKAVLVLLYHADSLQAFRRGRPLRAARTDASGHFRMTNLPNGRFRVFALRDLNSNYRYDLPNEEIAFHPRTLDLPGDTTAPTLLLFRERSTEQQVLSRKVTDQGAWLLELAWPVEAVDLAPLDWEGGRLSWLLEYGQLRDTVLCWPSDTNLVDGRRFVLSEAGRSMDTLLYRRSKIPYNVDVERRNTGDLPVGQFLLGASRPFGSLQPDRMRLIADKGGEARLLGVDSQALRQFVVRTDLAPGQRATLELLPKAVFDLYGGWNDTLRLTLGELAPEETGSLKLRLGTPAEADRPTLVLDLLNASGALVTKRHLENDPAPLFWSGLAPGTYQLRLLEDRNGNGAWDTGELASGSMPERVWRYPGNLVVRAGWDVSASWEQFP